MARSIDYGNLMHRAMRGVIQTVLADVAENGLPGNHHFFITFDTTAPGVEMADWLHSRYPQELTVVLQHSFDDLVVGDESFSVTLSFGNQPESLLVPFDAILTFVDPSVQFGLRFESFADDEGEEAGEDPTDDDDPPSPTPRDAEVVSLDKFRKQ